MSTQARLEPVCVNPGMLPPTFCRHMGARQAKLSLGEAGIPSGPVFYFDPARRVTGEFVSDGGPLVFNSGQGKLVTVWGPRA